MLSLRVMGMSKQPTQTLVSFSRMKITNAMDSLGLKDSIWRKKESRGISVLPDLCQWESVSILLCVGMYVCVVCACITTCVHWVCKCEFTLSICIDCALSYIQRQHLFAEPKAHWWANVASQHVHGFRAPPQSWDYKQAAIFKLYLFMWMLGI